MTSKPVLLRHRRTKIVATVGPASRDPAMLEQLIAAGVNVFRLNLSHGSQDEHRMNYGHIRAAKQPLHLADLPPASLAVEERRVGRFPDV